VTFFNLTTPVESTPFISRDWPGHGSKLYVSRCVGACDVEGDTDIWVGTWHLDCNGNLVDDLEDIAKGTSQDTNQNGKPDACESFRRGDANVDGSVDVSDPITTLGYLFLGVPATLDCDDAADCNDDGLLDVSDPVSGLGYIFTGKPPVLPAPSANLCGPDPSGDELTCESYEPPDPRLQCP
jgi:hypothetical protein